MSYNPITGGGGVGIGAPVSSGTAGYNLYVDPSLNLAQNEYTRITSSLTYDPANFFPGSASKVFWLKCWDAAYMRDASGNPGSNGVKTKTLLDSDGVTTVFENSTSGTQATFTTGLIGGFPGLVFPNTGIYPAISLDHLKNKHSATLGVVFSSVTAANTFYANTVNGGATDHFTAQVVSSTGIKLRLLATISAAGTDNTYLPPTVISQSAYHAALFEVNAVQGVASVYLDGETTNQFQLALTNGSAGPWPNSSATACNVGGGDNVFNLIDMFMFAEGLMTPWNRMQYFQAVKQKFSLTTY